MGLIGLGLLGSALAERLLGAGWQIVGFDVDAERRRRLDELGGQPLGSAREVVRQCHGTLLLSLPDSRVVEHVVGEVDGELTPPLTIIDTTTGDPRSSETLAARLAQRGIDYLDATVAGSSEQARAGEVLLMVGGRDEPFSACEALFATFAQGVFHVGPSGSGARMKLVVNLALGLNRAVLAEALALAGKCGIDAALALEVLKQSPAYSRAMDIKGEKMIRRDFEPAARLSQHLKDVRLILELGRQCEAKLPLSELHRRLLEEVEAAGLGAADNSAIIQAFD